jgi:outer membrane protein OmpA-like peptidoglycan-associated protein
MTLHFATYLSGKFLLGTGAARPCIDTPDETIEGFPEYAVNVDDLKDADAKKRLRALAKRIVASHNTSFRIIGFDVHGHADVTLKIPPGAERDQTEFEVSRDRAEAAQQLLFQMIEEEGGKAILAGIRANSKTVAVGSKCRKVPAPTEDEMKQNRRVEIFLKKFRFLPAPPSPPQPPKPGVKPQHWRLQIKNGSVATASVPYADILGEAIITLNVVITDLDRKKQADFVATAKGHTVGGSLVPSPLPAGASITNVLEGDPVDFTTQDQVQSVILENFEGTLMMGQNPGASASVKSIKGEFVMTFTALRVGTNPKSVTIPGGNDPLGLPQVSLGIQPADGSLKMKGSAKPMP